MEQHEIERAAREVISYVENAAGDITVGLRVRDIKEFYPDHYEKMREHGVEPRFMKEALADRLFGDVDWLADMSADRIYDEGKGDYSSMIAIAEEMKSRVSGDFREALDRHIERWTEQKEKMPC